MTKKKQETQQKKTKKHLFLNIAIGSLALVGSVGTIVFGTLWCKGRNVPAQEGVELNKQTLTLDVNASEKLFAIVDPIGCSQDITWSSNNKAVADVDTDGNVVAKSAGTATITAKATHCDSSADCIVTVQDVPVPPEPVDVYLDHFEKEVEQGDYAGSLSTSGYEIQKDQTITLISKMGDIDEIDKSGGLFNYSIVIVSPAGGEYYFPTFYGNCEFYIDDNLIPPDQYIYSSAGAEGYNFYLFMESLPVVIDYETSVFKLVITPYSEITSDVTFYAGCYFNDPE